MKYHMTSPIYQQILNDIKEKIIMGEYYATMQIPPVRELAIAYEVNPNTMQRSLSELEREGFVYSQRTAGRFVVDDADWIAQRKKELMNEKIDLFLQDMITFSLKEEEFISILKERVHAHVTSKKSN